MTKRANAKRVARQARREEKRQPMLELVVDDKHVDKPAVSPKRIKEALVARNPNQAKYLQDLANKPLVFSTGDAGCGKTYCATVFAAKALFNKEVDKIIVTRPVLQAEEDLGFLPGDIGEKFAPYFRPVYDVLVEQLGVSFVQYCMKPGIDKIEIAPFAYLRGRTFKNAIVLLDEAQNVTTTQMKLFLTRVGEGTQVIVNGDVTQCDLPKHKVSGLGDALARFQENDLIGITYFDKEDSVRGVVCSLALDAYS